MKHLRLAACMALIALTLTPALADSLALPSGLTEIQAEAFADDASITLAVLPEGLENVGDRAFAGCSSLERILIPASVEALGEDVLTGCTEDLLVVTEVGSAAMEYAQLNRRDYQADSRYRALILYQEYQNTSAVETLEGTKNDAIAMNAALSAFTGTPYEVVTRSELTASGMLDAIADAFGGAESQDVSLLYFSGHGLSSSNITNLGALVGSDGSSYVTATQLRAALDQIPGRKIVIIDACYSGNIISAGVNTRSVKSAKAAEAPTAEDFVDSFISAFSARRRSASAADCYFMLVAAAENEVSYENYIDDAKTQVMGLFTSRLVRGMGYNYKTGNFYSTLPADTSANNVLTANELYAYVTSAALTQYQHAQVSPEDSGWFGMLRK